MDIVFDFDGVLCEFDGNWRGHSHIGEPIEDVINLVIMLHKAGHSLRLCSTRFNPFPFGTKKKPDEAVMNGSAQSHVEDWLLMNNIAHCFDMITGYKPFGHLYIDDRAVRFEGDVREILKLIK